MAASERVAEVRRGGSSRVAVAGTAPVARASHEIRIVGGQWKRARLPVASVAGLRPTPDRVRETLFNWLGQDLTGWRCIDVFAGTGALGFEAASRGAQEVQLVEQDRGLARQLQAVKARLQADTVRVLRGDGVAALQQWSRAAVDLIFLDPPFEAGLYDSALHGSARALRGGGFVYLEARQEWSDTRLAPFRLCNYRHLKAGAVHAHLLRLLAGPNA